MSAKVTGWVLEHSPVVGAARLVLISLADRADNEGRNAYPSVSSIAHAARCSESTAHRVLRELEGAGHIVREGLSQHRTVNYRVVMQEPLAAPNPSDSRRVRGSEGGPICGDRPSDLKPEPSDLSRETPPMVGPKPTAKPSIEPSIEPRARADARPPALPTPPDLRGLSWQERNDRKVEHAAELEAHPAAFNAWATEHFPHADPKVVKTIVSLIAGGRREVTAESVRAYAEGRALYAAQLGIDQASKEAA